MIDICSGNKKSIVDIVKAETLANAKSPLGNFRMCEKITNPIDYVKERGWGSIFRFILSHPDMDHMDGLSRLVSEVRIHNFWDTGYERQKPSFEKSFYLQEDWDTYEALRSKSVDGVTSLTKIAGDEFPLANIKGDDGGSPDFLQICAPGKELLVDPNPNDDINEGSYIIVYRASTGKFVFPGDAHDSSWEFAIENYSNHLEDCAFLLAPHHGRDSNRSYDFLDVLKPKWTWIGCAPSRHIDYAQWDKRGLRKATSNQTGNVILELEDGYFDVYIENERYAVACGMSNLYKNAEGYTFLYRIETS